MKEMLKFLDRTLENRISNIHTAIIGEIKRINGSSADVQPTGLPLMVNVPLVKQKYQYTDTLDTEAGSGPTETRLIEGPVYAVGDNVLVIISERARDGKGNRKHDLVDGLIIGVVE